MQQAFLEVEEFQELQRSVAVIDSGLPVILREA